MAAAEVSASLDEELRLEEELAVARARKSMLAFVRHVTPTFQINWHHRVICRLLDDVAEGRLKRLIINIGPRHGKSELVSRHFPAYLFGRDPDTSTIAVSYSSDLAQRFNRDCQRIMELAAYQAVFPETQLHSKNIRTVAQGSWLRNSDIFEVVGRRGVYRCAGVGGGVTGMGGNVIIDDPLKNAEEAGSETVLNKHWEFYQSTLRTRLPKGGFVVLIATRWCDGDLAGRLVEHARANPDADQWRVLNLPAVNTAGPSDDDPRQVGEALWPDFFPRQELDKIRASSERTFLSMYQGDPVPPGGSIVQDDWWRPYFRPELPARWERLIMTCDLTFKDRGDYCVFQVWGKQAGVAWLVAQTRAKLAFSRQVDTAAAVYAEHPGLREVLVEDAANGAALVDTLRSRIPGLIAVSPHGSSKLARAEGITHIIEAGQVRIPDASWCPWVDAFRAEWRRFPYGAHDDIVDATTYALARLFPARARHANALPLSMTKAPAWRP